MRYLLVLLAIMLQACGSLPSVEGSGPNVVDPELFPYYQEFITYASSYGVALSGSEGLLVEFYELDYDGDTGVVGECSYIGYGNNTVFIDPLYWNMANEYAKKVLMFHELGHCLLNEIHSSDPDDIMYPYIGENIDFFQNQVSSSLQRFFSQISDNDH